MDFIPQYKAFTWLQKELQKSDKCPQVMSVDSVLVGAEDSKSEN